MNGQPDKDEAAANRLVLLFIQQLLNGRIVAPLALLVEEHDEGDG